MQSMKSFINNAKNYLYRLKEKDANGKEKYVDEFNQIKDKPLFSVQYPLTNVKDKTSVKYIFIEKSKLNDMVDLMVKENFYLFEFFSNVHPMNVKMYFDLEIERETLNKEECKNILNRFIEELLIIIKKIHHSRFILY